MAALEAALVTIVAIVAGIHLSRRRETKEARALESLFRLVMLTFWILAAFASIWTGYYVVGGAFLALFVFFASSNYQIVKNSDLRRRVANLGHDGDSRRR